MTIGYDWKKTALLALGAAVFVALGLWTALDPSQAEKTWRGLPVPVMGWVSVVFFGLALGVVVLRVSGKPALTLDTSGFTVAALRPWRMAWGEVDRFQIRQVGRSTRMVCVVRKAAGGEPLTLARLRGESASPGDKSLPTGLTLSPEALLNLMEEWRQRHAGG